MSNVIQVCLFNTEPTSSHELREHISAVNFVRLIGEVSTPEQLAKLIGETAVNMVFFHLDPDPARVIEVIDQFSARYPETALIAISHETGPDAILPPIRAGCDQFVCEPIDAADLGRAVSRVASKRFLAKPKSRCVCVIGASGGVGATTLASNLAMEIGHLAQKPCALVDLDFQLGDVAVNFDCDPKYTFYDLSQSEGTLDRTLLGSVLTQLPCNVQLLARPEQVEQFQAITPDLVHHAIEVLTGMFETVVVDVPRRFDPHTMSVIGQADLIIIVCQLLVPSVRNATRIHQTLVRAGVPEDRLELVLNRGDSGGGRLTVKDLEDTLKKSIFAVVPNDYQYVARSLDFGKPVSGQDRNNPVRAAITKIAHTITGDSATGDKDAGRRGFLSRLLSK